MISLTNHDSSEGEQWGRDQIYPDRLYISRKVREPNREPGTEPCEPETAQKPAVGKPNRTEPLMYKISSRTGRTGGRNRMRTAGMCSVCFSQANVPLNLCPRIGFVFFWKPQKKAKTQPLCPPIGFVFLQPQKKQNHNPCALLLDFFLCGSTTKAKSTTLVPSYWICFFWKPTPKKKQKHDPRPLCPPIGLVFLKHQKRKNTTPMPSYSFFWKHQKRKNTTLVPS